MTIFRPRGDTERGQVLVIVAAGMIVFLLIAGLVIDAGIGFRAKRDSQNASDLASLAGTKVIADNYLSGTAQDGADVNDAIESNLSANNCLVVDGCTWSAEYVDGTGASMGIPVTNAGAIPGGAQGVLVTANRNPETFFMRAAGIDTLDVTTESTAMTFSFDDWAPAGALLPVGVFDSPYEPGVTYELTDGMNGPGQFGWLSWTGSTAMTTLWDSVCTPDNPEITFPEWIPGAPGTKNGIRMRECMQGYVDNQTTVLLPVWSQTNGMGGAGLEYEIIGLAAFVLTDFSQPTIDTIEGRFVEFYALPSVPGGYGSGVPCNPLIDPDQCTTKTNFIGLTE